MVVTSTHVTKSGSPILYVCREFDEDGVSTWQFLSGHTFSMEDAQLVRLDTIVALDPSVREIAALPIGYAATRDAAGAAWDTRPES